MPVALAVWSMKVEPGEPIEFAPEGDLVITNAALGDEIADEKSRTSLKLRYLAPHATEESDSEEEKEEKDEEDEDEDEAVIIETVLCSLTPGKIEQANINLTLDGDSEYLLEAVGKNTLYLSGNYIDQTPGDVPFNDESDSEDEDGYDLRDVSSDVEMDPAEMMGIDGDESDDTDANRFEEVHEEETTKSNKRPRESDAADADKPSPSKAQEKKAKKQKAANGEAVPAAEPAIADAADAKAEKKQKKKEKKEKEAAAAKEANKGGELKTLPSGLQIKDIKVGNGPQAKVGNTVSMRYIGKLQNGKVFDKNTTGGPFTFKLGRGEVIKGWDEGIKGMAVGGERLLVVPAALGYGKKGMKPDIPGNATLTFETKLVNIK